MHTIHLNINAFHILIVSVVLTYMCFAQLCFFLSFQLKNIEDKDENDTDLCGQVLEPLVLLNCPQGCPKCVQLLAWTGLAQSGHSFQGLSLKDR